MGTPDPPPRDDRDADSMGETPDDDGTPGTSRVYYQDADEP